VATTYCNGDCHYQLLDRNLCVGIPVETITRCAEGPVAAQQGDTHANNEFAYGRAAIAIAIANT
jgi:hypothetical protein